MQLACYQVDVPVMLAPMAGMSDLPYREICRSLGAGYAVGEMTSSKPDLRDSKRAQHVGLKPLKVVCALYSWSVLFPNNLPGLLNMLKILVPKLSISIWVAQPKKFSKPRAVVH